MTLTLQLLHWLLCSRSEGFQKFPLNLSFKFGRIIFSEWNVCLWCFGLMTWSILLCWFKAKIKLSKNNPWKYKIIQACKFSFFNETLDIAFGCSSSLLESIMRMPWFSFLITAFWICFSKTNYWYFSSSSESKELINI